MPERISAGLHATCVDLGCMPYQTALDEQLSLVERKISLPQTQRQEDPDTLLFVEHPLVFTLGKRGGREYLKVSEKFLIDNQIDLIQTQRGGYITCHAPGQLVVYTIFDIHRLKLGVKEFVYLLEEIIKKTLADLGLNSDRNNKNNGIWINNKKIASIGLSIKHRVSMHGVSINVFNDLTPFSWMAPCGLEAVSVTSVKKEFKSQNRSFNIQLTTIKNSLCKHFTKIFGYTSIKQQTSID